MEVKKLDNSYLDKFDIKYNYEHFCADHLNYQTYDGPMVGDYIDNHQLFKLNGDRVFLHDILTAKTVIELASFSCPNYRSNIQTMRELNETFAAVKFVVVYVREEHPGSIVSRHHCLTDKFGCANKLKNELGEDREVLLDDIDGCLHKNLGGMPNSCVVLNSDGQVLYSSNWTVPRHLQYLLSGLMLDKKDRPDKGVVKPEPIKIRDKVKTYLDCGVDSLRDVIVSAPELIKKKNKYKKTH